MYDEALLDSKTGKLICRPALDTIDRGNSENNAGKEKNKKNRLVRF